MLIQAGDWRDAAFQQLHDLEAVDLIGGASQPITAMSAAYRLDDAGLAQNGEDLLEVLVTQVLASGDGLEADGAVA